MLYISLAEIRGQSKKKSESWFVDCFCCFIQTICINGRWKFDFWHVRGLFYQVETILIHFQKLENFSPQNFPWNTAKMVKILQHLKILKMWYLRHAEHHAKNRTSQCGLDQEILFFDWPLISTSKFDQNRSTGSRDGGGEQDLLGELCWNSNQDFSILATLDL